MLYCDNPKIRQRTIRFDGAHKAFILSTRPDYPWVEARLSPRIPTLSAHDIASGEIPTIPSGSIIWSRTTYPGDPRYLRNIQIAETAEKILSDRFGAKILNPTRQAAIASDKAALYTRLSPSFAPRVYGIGFQTLEAAKRIFASTNKTDVIIRNSLQHSGRKISLVSSVSDIPRALNAAIGRPGRTMMCEFVSSTYREYAYSRRRLWIVGGRMARETLSVSNSDWILSDNGSLIEPDTPQEVLDLIEWIVSRQLGLDLAAVDFILAQDGRLAILDVNPCYWISRRDDEHINNLILYLEGGAS